METLVDKRSKIETEVLVQETKDIFEKELTIRLNLSKVMAPLFVSKGSGLNDDLNGIERAVGFNLNGIAHQIVHSLAKWKRWYLNELKVSPGYGIVTDMRAIRADEVISDIHSNLVDQWDWEKVIDRKDRSMVTLIDNGIKVYDALRKTDEIISSRRLVTSYLPERLTVIHAEEVLQLYPELDAKEREDAITKKYGAVLLIGIGGKLSTGERHDLRAPDYDDWITKNEFGHPGMNADLIVWDETRGKSLEISSMGIRVDEESLKEQLLELGQENRMELPFHQALLNGELPYTIGGGIGQSRVAMLVNRISNIADVQSPVI
jgi:aspartate--ammonia ligase